MFTILSMLCAADGTSHNRHTVDEELRIHPRVAVAQAGGKLGWNQGNVCPAGAQNYDGSKDAYGNLGFDWVGDIVHSETNIGNPESCCQIGGGDGIHGIGLFYSMCNPRMGCADPNKAYTCTVYKNVTGTKAVGGVLAGRAQAPVVARQLERNKTSTDVASYANPWNGACKSAPNASGFDELKASMLATVTEHWPHGGGADPVPEYFNISGAICAPQCGCIDPSQPRCAFGKLYPCPTDLPAGTTATPECLLIGGMDDNTHSACALVCDPSDPSGTGGSTSKCPEGATCEPMYSKARVENAGIFNSGICTYLK